MNERKELVAAYVPVIHQGYIDLFDRHKDAMIGVLDDDVLDLFSYLKKDIRALRPEKAYDLIEGLGREVRFLGQTALRKIISADTTNIVMPDDDVSHTLVDVLETPTERVTFEPVFLRWDRQNTKANVEAEPDARISVHELHPDIVALLIAERQKSANSWRQVAAVAAQGNHILAASHNHSMPTPYTAAIDADPRNIARRGEAIELSNDIHAESELIAAMAKQGQSLNRSDIYVTTFPCPNCAKLIATAGIERCFYGEGYAMLDGQSVLRSAGVKLVKINDLKLTAPEHASRHYPPERAS